MSEPRRLSALAFAAALVLGACGGGGGGPSTEPQTEPTEAETTGTPAADIVVLGTNANQFEPSEFEVEAGTISVAMTSEAGPHTFTVELEEGNETVVQLFSAGTGEGEIELEAGTYTFFCSIPLHRDQGMEGILTVT
jgi:plastocyanin